MDQQLQLLELPPVRLGWVINDLPNQSGPRGPILGNLDELEVLIARRRPAVALVSFPGVMKDLISSVRTRLRKLGVPDRFMPTLEDQIEGIGPRSHLDVELSALIDRPAREIDDEAVAGVIRGKRVLITGAGGSIGSELARIVARYEPNSLILIDRSENALFEIDRQIARKFPALSRKSLLHDVVEPTTTLAHFRRLRPQVIFHAAAHKHVPMMEDHPASAVDNNLFGTKAVADAADEIGAERFVMISTDKAVNPSSIMGATKRLAELYVQHINRRSATAFSMVRFGNVLGSSGSVLETWSRQIADGGPITVTDPRMTRYFMTIPEAAALVIQSAALVDLNAECGEVFLLNMGDPVRVVDLASRFIQLHGLDPVLPQIETTNSGAGTIAVVFTGARPGEKLHEELAFDAEAMRPTRHPDVNIWELPTPADSFIQQMISRLSPARRWSDPAALAREIRGLIPEIQQPVAA